MLKAVIFDVDGTLVDSNDLHAQAWQRAFLKFGYHLPYRELRQQVGKGGDNYIPYFLSPSDNKQVGRELDRYKSELFRREYQRHMRPFPAVRELFERIESQGLKIALATSAKGDELEQYLELLNIKDLLDERTSKDDAAHSKPHPDVFAAALEKLEVVSMEAIAVGDTPYDAQACSKIDLPIMGVLCGGFHEEELRSAGCRAIYRDPADILTHFNQSPLCPEIAA